MTWSVQPEPSDEHERKALLDALERVLADEAVDDGSAWWRSGLDDLGGGPAAQEPWRDSGVIEP